MPGRQFDRAAFETLYGRPLPADVEERPGHYTLDTPLADMRSPVARLLMRVMRRQAMAFVGGDPKSPLGRIISAAIGDMNLRMFRMMTGGAVDGRLLDGLLLLVNGRYGLGLRTVLRAALPAPIGGPGTGGEPGRQAHPPARGGRRSAGRRVTWWSADGASTTTAPVARSRRSCSTTASWTTGCAGLGWSASSRPTTTVSWSTHAATAGATPGTATTAPRPVPPTWPASSRPCGSTGPIVGGHSMGADTSISLAVARPDLVRAVFLEDPPLLTPGEPLFGGEMGRRVADAGKAMSRFMSVFRYLPAGAGRALARRMTPTYSDLEIRPWVESKRRLSRDVLRTLESSALAFHGSMEELRRVDAPVLLVIGDRDAGAIVSEEIAAEAAATMPNLRVAHLAGASHDIRRARFDAYMEALRDFLDRSSERHGTA